MTKKISKEQDLKKFDGRNDELDPRYIFNMTATQLLTEALKGEFDITYLIKRQLANRGLDREGKWIGFDKAKELHQIK
ncbi:MAG: hypothetical protein ACLQQ4_01745 [Bacteroidia bacterium]